MFVCISAGRSGFLSPFAFRTELHLLLLFCGVASSIFLIVLPMPLVSKSSTLKTHGPKP